MPPSIRTTLSKRQVLNIQGENLTCKRRELVVRIKEDVKLKFSRLLMSDVTELAESLRVASVLAYYGEFLKGFDKEGYIFGNDSDNSLRMDIAFCQHCLEDLEGLARRTAAPAAVQEMPTATLVLRDRRRRVKPVT